MTEAPNEIEKSTAEFLLERYGPLLGAKDLAEVLRFSGTLALERSMQRGHLNLRTFHLRGRRGAFEAHHLIDRGRMKSHAHLGDCLKEFSDQVECSIGLCGAPRLRLLFETNNQLRNRWSSSFVLRPFSYDDGQSALASFILALMQGSISKGNEDYFQRADTINRIQYATDGVPAQVVKLMQNVKKVMASSGELSLLVLDQAWNFPGTSHLPARRRPFQKDFNFERLMGIDEPFFPSSFDGDNHANFS